jgi:ABC-type lipoprotein export system ATPase subunit
MSILLLLYGLNIPLTSYMNRIQKQLSTELLLSNNIYFNERIIKISKQELLNFDLVRFFTVLTNIQEDITNFLVTMKYKYDIPIKMISVFILSIYNKNQIIIFILPLILFTFYKLYKKNIKLMDNELTNMFNVETDIKNYIINSKFYLVNNLLNTKYIKNEYEKYTSFKMNIHNLINNLQFKSSSLVYLFILIVMSTKYKIFTPEDFLIYFYLVYDIEAISDSFMRYINGVQDYNQANTKLNILYSFEPDKEDFIDITNNTIDNITISMVKNDAPYLDIKEEINIHKGDAILVDGASGSGKTSLLYILKGIVTPKDIIIKPDLKTINAHTFITLPNHKSVFNSKLYDLISNFDENPDIDLINDSIVKSQLETKFNGNMMVDIEKLSGGERIRVVICRIIYTIKKNNYDILLFDEIDDNLNDALAQEICTNIKKVFSDKIILYISHNSKVKQMFDKKILIKKGKMVSKNF